MIYGYDSYGSGYSTFDSLDDTNSDDKNAFIWEVSWYHRQGIRLVKHYLAFQDKTEALLAMTNIKDGGGIKVRLNKAYGNH